MGKALNPLPPLKKRNTDTAYYATLHSSYCASELQQCLPKRNVSPEGGACTSRPLEVGSLPLAKTHPRSPRRGQREGNAFAHERVQVERRVCEAATGAYAAFFGPVWIGFQAASPAGQGGAPSCAKRVCKDGEQHSQGDTGHDGKVGEAGTT